MENTIYEVERATCGLGPQIRALFIQGHYPESVIADLKHYALEHSNLLGDDTLIAISDFL